jgi:glutamate synthase domain-containing protein 3
VARQLLADWDNAVDQFVKVMPIDYKRVLEQMKREAETHREEELVIHNGDELATK